MQFQPTVGRAFVCVCMCVSVCLCACVCACVCACMCLPSTLYPSYRSEISDFANSKKWVTAGPTDRRTNGRTDRRTDRSSYRDARSHLKTSRPNARYGHQYPCPALVFHNGVCYVSRTVALRLPLRGLRMPLSGLSQPLRDL